MPIRGFPTPYSICTPVILDLLLFILIAPPLLILSYPCLPSTLHNMQASRAFTRVIAAGSKTTRRSLHMTGPAPFSSLLTSNQPIALGSNVPRSPVSAAVPVPDTTDTGRPVRHFNTSRSLKAVRDSSTIDFMFVPDFDPDLNSAPVQIRVPLVPWSNPSEANKVVATEAEEPVSFPTCSSSPSIYFHTQAMYKY